MTKSEEKQLLNTKNTMSSSFEKCLEMSHSKEQERLLRQSLASENASSLERSILRDFRSTDNEDFSTVSSSKLRLPSKKEPSYRKIQAYFKSKHQYCKERNRRKLARQLSDEGYTYKQIADKLGVTERTIQRDMNKTKSYRRGQMNKMLREFREEQQIELHKQMEGMNQIEQLKFITRKLIEHQNLMKERDYTKRTLTFTINLDAILNTLEGQPYGRPWITASPKTLNCSLSQLKLNFRVKSGAQTIPYSTVTFR